MSNYDGASKSLDNLRGIIIGGVEGFKPTDITMLGRISEWLEHTEMMLRHEQSKHIVRDTRKGEWPELTDYVHMWSGFEWMSRLGCDVQSPHHLWLPAPPPPTDD